MDPFRRSSVASGSGAPASATMPVGNGSAQSVSFAAARSELGEAATGRISLAILNTFVLALVVFYIWTRKAQGGG